MPVKTKFQEPTGLTPYWPTSSKEILFNELVARGLRKKKDAQPPKAISAAILSVFEASLFVSLKESKPLLDLAEKQWKLKGGKPAVQANAKEMGVKLSGSWTVSQIVEAMLQRLEKDLAKEDESSSESESEEEEEEEEEEEIPMAKVSRGKAKTLHPSPKAGSKSSKIKARKLSLASSEAASSSEDDVPVSNNSKPRKDHNSTQWSSEASELELLKAYKAANERNN